MNLSSWLLRALLLGGLMAAQLPTMPYLNNEQLQSLPAWLLLLLGGLLIA